jgi:hypothetical protein
MAGIGQNMVLDKGFLLLSTYNSSAAAGALSKRLVKFSGTAGAVDLNVAINTRSVGVLMENVDAVKIATGKVVADVRMLGVATINCTTAASVVLGSLVMSSTVGGCLLLATTGSFPVGMVVGITGTLADGNDIQVLLVPGLPAIP